MTLTQATTTVRQTTFEDVRPWSPPPRPSVQPTIMASDGSVVAMRKRRVIAPGAFDQRLVVDSSRLVCAQDPAGRSWWIPADAVWSDAQTERQPQHPWSVGLAMGRSRDAAMVCGLSDRLGWEANESRLRGHALPVLDGDDGGPTLYDGRLDHDVPTVVLVKGSVVCWGAGSTFDIAHQRALFGHRGVVAGPSELPVIAAMLAAKGLEVVAVDLGTPLIRRAGVVRSSIQLAVASHDDGRPWDGPPVK